MKVTRKGTVKLEKGEVRIGNFFVKDEDNHIKLQDLNGVFSHRVHKNMAIGIWLSNMLQGGQKDPACLNSIKTYIGAMWSMFSVVPDNEFITGGIALANDCMKRHPDWYGVKLDATPEEDAEALEEVKELTELEEDLRKAEGKTEEL